MVEKVFALVVGNDEKITNHIEGQLITCGCKVKKIFGKNCSDDLMKTIPDIIVLDCQIIEQSSHITDWIAYILNKSSKTKEITVVAYCPEYMETFNISSFAAKVSYFVAGVPTENILLSIINDMKEKKLLSVKSKKIIISNLLYTLNLLGITSNLCGFYYLKDAVMSGVEDSNCIKYVTKNLYPVIAKKYDTTSSAVERAIRHAINRAFKYGDLSILEKIGFNRAKSTNAEFIALLVELVKLQSI